MDYPVSLPKKLIPYATAIGTVCIDWSYLEITINDLLRTLIRIQDNEQFQTICHNIDFRERITIILQLSFRERLANKSDIWFATMKRCLDEIDNSIRTRRNRFIHDQWILRGSGEKAFQVQRLSKKPSLKREPKTGLYTHITEQIGDESHEDIVQLSADIHAMSMRLSILRTALDGNEDWETLLEEIAPLSPRKGELGLDPG